MPRLGERSYVLGPPGRRKQTRPIPGEPEQDRSWAQRWEIRRDGALEGSERTGIGSG